MQYIRLGFKINLSAGQIYMAKFRYANIFYNLYQDWLPKAAVI